LEDVTVLGFLTSLGSSAPTSRNDGIYVDLVEEIEGTVFKCSLCFQITEVIIKLDPCLNISLLVSCWGVNIYFWVARLLE
jgi:hypothetical protein